MIFYNKYVVNIDYLTPSVCIYCYSLLEMCMFYINPVNPSYFNY